MLKSTHSKTYAKFLSWLKAARVEKGLTIRQLADLLGEHSSVIGKIEVGERRLDIYEYCQYCSVLELDPMEGLAFLKR